MTGHHAAGTVAEVLGGGRMRHFLRSHSGGFERFDYVFLIEVRAHDPRNHCLHQANCQSCRHQIQRKQVEKYWGRATEHIGGCPNHQTRAYRRLRTGAEARPHRRSCRRRSDRRGPDRRRAAHRRHRRGRPCAHRPRRLDPRARPVRRSRRRCGPDQPARNRSRAAQLAH